ncbi:MAG: hypothetical protein ACFFKA_22425 [Candidatus Thorarchaeota archaeon]
MESPKNREIQKKLRARQFLILMFHLTIFPYLLILFIFQYLYVDEIVDLSVIPGDITMFTFLFILISGIMQIVVYKFWIPLMKKKDKVDDAFFVGYMIIYFGGEISSEFGLIIGIIGFLNYNYVFWPISLPFILIGFGIKSTLYLFKIKPYLDKFKE